MRTFERRVWRYQKGNQNPISKKNRQHNGQRKSTKGQLWSTKHTHKTKDRVTRTPLKTVVYYQVDVCVSISVLEYTWAFFVIQLQAVSV